MNQYHPAFTELQNIRFLEHADIGGVRKSLAQQEITVSSDKKYLGAGGQLLQRFDHPLVFRRRVVIAQPDFKQIAKNI